MPAIFYGYETWSLTLREERRLRVYENRVLRRIFGPRRDEVTGEWRKLHEELNHLTPNGHFSGRTTQLTYRCCIFLFIQQIYILNSLNMLHALRFFLFKMSFIS
jgi:hypothetical protein